VDSDFGSVRRALRDGRVDTALRDCHGPLLPLSDAPEIRELRDELTAGLRLAVLKAQDVDLLHAFARNALGAGDLEVHERLVELLPPDDPSLGPLVFRRARLRKEWGTRPAAG
jgi:hypothetical protein